MHDGVFMLHVCLVVVGQCLMVVCLPLILYITSGNVDAAINLDSCMFNRNRKCSYKKITVV